MHLVHKMMGMDDLTCTVADKSGLLHLNYGSLILAEGMGDMCTVLTTYPSYLCKWIWKLSGYGDYNTAVCLEGKSVATNYYKAKPCFRKEYFEAQGTNYKGGRKALPLRTVQGCQFAYNKMAQGGVKLYGKEGYEADDVIYTLINQIKQTDTTTPIDVITNDRDLLPLVDEQVSVYIKTTKMDYNEPECPYVKGYFQVTPRTWSTYISNCSEYKKNAGTFNMPYNSVLLYKMIKGDKSDNIDAAVKPYGVVKFNKMIDLMVEQGVDFPNVFRYSSDFDMEILPVIAPHFQTDQLAKMKFIKEGISLRNIDLGKDIQGRPLRFAMPTPIDYGTMSSAVADLHIKLSLQ